MKQKPTRNVKPKTPLARAKTTLRRENEALDRDHRKTYDKYDADVKKYGQRIADFNAGYAKALSEVLVSGKMK